MTDRRIWLPRMALAAFAFALGGCEMNPATGKQSFTAFMGRQDELRVGAEEHPKILAQFGGEYRDPAISRYIGELGRRMAAKSEMADLNFTFTVLNSDVVNAFALPGGYVYVTRGLMALASSEAELGGVLSHEIGHVTARHSAERYSSSVAAAIGLTLLGAAIGDRQIVEIAQYGAEAYLASYSREQESEADMLGIRYLTRNGYNPFGVASFLRKLELESALRAKLAGKPGEADRFDMMQSHPRTSDRVQAAITQAREVAPAGTVPDGGENYLRVIDGLYVDGDPENGFVKRRRFIHPNFRFQFEVPPGFRIVNGARQVTAVGPQDSRIVFDADRRPPNASMLRYVHDVWAHNLSLSAVEPLTIDGMEAATGTGRVTIPGRGAFDVRLVAIRFDANTVYRFRFYTARGLTEQLALPLRQTTYSFRRLSAAEAQAATPSRLRILAVGAGDTTQSLARRMAYDDEQVARFETLNGLAPGEQPRIGSQVKIVAD
ncbi:MAG: peptidase M48 [Rhodospirillaceae bacterium]|nr:peptidase M48 [Rhodospirillaceae bacterium]